MLTDMAATGSVHPEERRLCERRLSIVTVATNAFRQIVVIWAAKMKKKLKKKYSSHKQVKQQDINIWNY